jgi:uncharacterized protein
VRRFNLRSLRFGPGSEAWRGLPVETEPFVFGGVDYTVEGGVVDLELHAARVNDQLTLKARLETVLEGPCQRCLGEARVPVTADGFDYVRHGDSEGGEDEAVEGYARGFVLDVERWVRDLIGDALPAQLLCAEDCAGLCPVCGADLNEEPDHTHEA